MPHQAAAALDNLAALLAVFNDNELYRVLAGPFASRGEAQHAANQVLDKLLLVPLVVEPR